MYHLLRCFGFALFMLPTIAVADVEERCSELWFARNAMLNEPGYCFSTPLGRSLFDNSDCTTRQPVVNTQVSEQISIIQRLEQNPPFLVDRDQSCQVDTSQRDLDNVSYLELRKQVTFQPATDGTRANCIGYQGRAFPVYAAPDQDAAVLGFVEQGFSLSLSHLPWQDWKFAIVWRNPSEGDPVAIGWYRQDVGESNCGFVAG